MNRRRIGWASGLGFAFAVGLGMVAHEGTARANVTFGPHDVKTVFAISKSEDRNEVHYGIRLDENCMPVGDEPVFGYWLKRENGPNVTDDLTVFDKQGYGIKNEWVTKRSPEGSKVLITLRQFERPIGVVVKKGENGQCVADTFTTISGAGARLDGVYLHIAGFLKVDWMEIRGRTVANNQPIVEHVNH